MPDEHGRYYTIQFLDAYTNTFAYVGRRVTGTQEGNYAIVGPQWVGSLPEGVNKIKSPTNTVWLLGRTLVNGEADLPVAQALQQQYTLTPLSVYGSSAAPNTAQLGLSTATVNLPSPQAIASSGFAFYDELDLALQSDPPPAEQRPLLEQFTQFGIGPKRGTLQLNFNNGSIVGLNYTVNYNPRVAFQPTDFGSVFSIPGTPEIFGLIGGAKIYEGIPDESFNLTEVGTVNYSAANSVPEPASTWGDLALGILGTCYFLRRKQKNQKLINNR